MSKQNILEKITDAYHVAMAEQDLGVRLLALEDIRDKIGKVVKKPFKNSSHREDFDTSFRFTGGLITALGLTAGVAIATPAAIPNVVDLVIGFGTLITGGVGGGMTAGRLASSTINRRNLNYATHIMPYVPALEDLSSQIRQDLNALHADNNAAALQSSVKLRELLAKHPSLLDNFNKANRASYEKDKKTAKLESKNNGGLSL